MDKLGKDRLLQELERLYEVESYYNALVDILADLIVKKDTRSFDDVWKQDISPLLYMQWGK